MDQEIIEYHLYAAEVDETSGEMRCPLTTNANEFIDDGWQPYGNLFVFTSADGTSRICQTFVRYAPSTHESHSKPHPHRVVSS